MKYKLSLLSSFMFFATTLSGQSDVRGVIASGTARFNNGSVVTLGQPFVGTMNAVDGGVMLQAGIVPTFTSSLTNVFSISPAVSLREGRFKLGFLVAPGQSWAVLGSTNLVDWVPVWSGTATEPRVEFEDSTAILYTHRFYRVRIP